MRCHAIALDTTSTAYDAHASNPETEREKIGEKEKNRKENTKLKIDKAKVSTETCTRYV